MKRLCNWYIAQGETSPTEMCVYACSTSVCMTSCLFLTLLTWTVDPRLQAEPEEKKNGLGRPLAGHLFLWDVVSLN